MKDEYWKTKEGVNIKLSDMEDSHLQNSINMVQKRYENLLSTATMVAGTIQKLELEKVRRKDAKKAAERAAKFAAQKAAWDKARESDKIANLAKIKETPTGRKFRIE